MRSVHAMLALGFLTNALSVAAAASPAPTPTAAQLVAAAPDTAWRGLDETHTLYMELPQGRVVIELAPALAPRTVANIEALVRLHYFDGLSVLRVQDDYVAQWGDPDDKRPVPETLKSIVPEFGTVIPAAQFRPLPDHDGYAAQTGFINSFPAARDPVSGQAWLTHCYAAVGVGRDNDPASGNGSALYAVIGQAPRQLDRNVTVVGYVRQGIELLSTLPRGPAPMGFYPEAAQRVPISSVRIAADVAPEQRTRLQILKTDSPAFTAWVESRRNRREEWYRYAAGFIDVCNIPIPVRAAPTPKG